MLRERLREDGYLLFPHAIDPQLVDAARRDLLARFHSMGVVATADEPTWTGAPRDAIDPDALYVEDPGFVQLALSESFAALLATVHSEPVVVYRHVNIRYSLPEDDRHLIPAHQDAMYIGPFKSFLTYWIPLVDIAEGAGGLALAPASHHRGLLPHPPSDRFQISYMGDRRPARAIDTDEIPMAWATTSFRAGDLLLFDSHLVHAGLPNRSNRVRISIDARYQLASDPMSNWQARRTVLEGARRRRDVLAVLGPDVDPEPRERVVEWFMHRDDAVEPASVAIALDETRPC